MCATWSYQKLKGRKEAPGKRWGGGTREDRGSSGGAERQHGGATSVAVLTFSPLEPGCQQKPPGPDSSQTSELRWRNKGCSPLGSPFPSATVISSNTHGLRWLCTPKHPLRFIVWTSFTNEGDAKERFACAVRTEASGTQLDSKQSRQRSKKKTKPSLSWYHFKGLSVIHKSATITFTLMTEAQGGCIYEVTMRRRQPFAFIFHSYIPPQAAPDQINEGSQGPLESRLLLVIALNASLQWGISERTISNLIMVTLSKECPRVLQINRGCLLFGLRGTSRAGHQGFDSWPAMAKLTRESCGPQKEKSPMCWRTETSVLSGHRGRRCAAPSPELLLTLLLLCCCCYCDGSVSTFPPSLPLSWSISVLRSRSRTYELMTTSKVIKCSADGDTDPGRVAEGQAVHVGFGLPAVQLSSSFPPSPWPQGCIEHRFGLIGLLGIRRKSAGGKWHPGEVKQAG